jgi:anti-sigma regulatory factor (Ser/Thr protein kinase)
MRSDDTAPRRAREALRGLDAIDPVRDDAILVASELVSNAVLHAGADPSEEIELIAEVGRSALRLVVTDPGHSERMPTVRGSEYCGPGGRGLRVVEALARRWGRERRRGTVVWVELSLETSNLPGHPG